jgi:hypothetical protein
MFVVSVAFPQSSFMWLATLSTNFTLLRIVLITLLATLLITTPFVDHHMNGLLGILGFSIITWVVLTTYSNNMQILDSLAFMGAGLSLAIEALEPASDHVANERPWREEVRYQAAVYTLSVYALTRLLALTHPFGERHHEHRPRTV